MSEENQVEATEGGEEKTPVEPQRLCKGTMPSILVWFIKFHESHENKSAVAKKYFTTPGKISDIQGNANQKYIVEGMKWSAEEIEQARAAIKENFTRGQEAEAIAPGSVSKRGLATTQAGDEVASLEALDTIEAMDFAEDAVSITDARTAYNEANPRAPRKAKAADEDTAASDEAAVDPVDLDDDDLL